MKKVIALSQKGGTGKTFLADEFVHSLERTGIPWAFYDLDVQGGSQHTTTENPEAAVAVIDTPGRLDEHTADFIADADLIILPTRAGSSEIPALENIRNLIGQYAPKTPVVLVLNGWNTYINSRIFADYLLQSKKDNETLICMPQGEAVPRATALKESVSAAAPRTRVGSQARVFTNAVRRLLGMALEPEIPYVSPSRKDQSHERKKTVAD